MSDTDRLWDLQRFPDTTGAPPGEIQVQQAYESWLRRCAVDPYSVSKPVDFGGDRYTAEVPGARFTDANLVEQQFGCDFDVRPGSWGAPGQVVYVESGFVPAADQPG